MIRQNISYVKTDDLTKEGLMKTALRSLGLFLEDKGNVSMDEKYNLLINEIIKWTFALINSMGCTYVETIMKIISTKEDSIYNLLKPRNLHFNRVVWINAANSCLIKSFTSTMISSIKSSKCEYIKHLNKCIFIKPLAETEETLLSFCNEYFEFCCKVIDLVSDLSLPHSLLMRLY